MRCEDGPRKWPSIPTVFRMQVTCQIRAESRCLAKCLAISSTSYSNRQLAAWRQSVNTPQLLTPDYRSSRTIDPESRAAGIEFTLRGQREASGRSTFIFSVSPFGLSCDLLIARLQAPTVVLQVLFAAFHELRTPSYTSINRILPITRKCSRFAVGAKPAVRVRNYHHAGRKPVPAIFSLKT